MKQVIINIVQGIAIGIGNIIPGLSGSTIAVILGIYKKLINIITKFNFSLIKLILKCQFKEAKNYISLNFLISIGIGIIISFIFMSNILRYLFKHFEIYTWAYFFGIIFISIWYISKYVTKWRIIEYGCLCIGLLISLILFFTEPNMQENKNLIFVFICGIIGVVGMLIPGLSGSYLLILLGNYELLFSKAMKILDPYWIKYYLSGGNTEEFILYLKLFLFFLAGHIFGILAFSRIIKWLINNYQNPTFATLTGFISGSLIWIWPWKNKNTDWINSKIDLISFPAFNELTDLYIILIMCLGSMSIIIIEKLGKKYKNV